MKDLSFDLFISPSTHFYSLCKKTFESKIYILFLFAYNMERSLLVKFLGENPVFSIIDFLIENKGVDVTKKEIIEGAGISRAALFKYWRQLEEQEIVVVTRRFGKTRLYKLNVKNPVVKKLLELESVLIGKALDKHRLIEVSS